MALNHVDASHFLRMKGGLGLYVGSFDLDDADPEIEIHVTCDMPYRQILDVLNAALPALSIEETVTAYDLGYESGQRAAGVDPDA